MKTSFIKHTLPWELYQAVLNSKIPGGCEKSGCIFFVIFAGPNLKKMNINATYPDFEHEAQELNRYIEASALFSILLRSGTIVHHRPAHADDFRNWLTSHDIINLRDNDD